jgi:hypothetical protein
MIERVNFILYGYEDRGKVKVVFFEPCERYDRAPVSGEYYCSKSRAAKLINKMQYSGFTLQMLSSDCFKNFELSREVENENV